MAVHALISNFENDVWDAYPLRKTVIESMITNASRERARYSNEERDFWLDSYNNMLHRQFNKLAEVLNGPWPSTVESWQERSKFDIFGLNWSTIHAYSSSLYPDSLTSQNCMKLVTNLKQTA